MAFTQITLTGAATGRIVANLQASYKGHTGGSISNVGDESVKVLCLADEGVVADTSSFSVELPSGTYFEIPDFWFGIITAFADITSTINISMRDNGAFDLNN